MKVVVTRPKPDLLVKKLKERGFDVTVREGTKPEELIGVCREANAVLVGLDDKIDAAFFAATTPQLKIVANYAVGFDNIDLVAAKEHNVFVTNTPDVLTEAVAEHTLAMILAVTCRIPEADRYVRAGKWQGPFQWNFMLGIEVAGKTLGIVGPGRIGSRVAEIATALHMNIEMCGSKDNIDDCIGRFDVVSLHVPLLDSTRHLINESRLKKMKPTAYLINTARGPVVDEVALVNALQTKQIAGAAIDVFENEPAIHPDLLALENVVLTPHIASATIEARTQMTEVAATNIIEALEGRTPPNLVPSP